MSGHKHESAWANIGSCKVWEINDQNLLGVNIITIANQNSAIIS